MEVVGDATHHRGIQDLARRKVRREDHEAVERDRKLLSGVQCQEIDAALERQHPAVENLLGPRDLAPEIVNDEYTAGHLRVQRRLVVEADRIVLQVEHVHRQLAAGHDDRAGAPHPPPVIRRNLRFDERRPHVLRRLSVDTLCMVHCGIEDLDHLALDLDRKRHPQRLLEAPGDGRRDGRFPITRWAVEQHAPSRIDGWSQARDEVGRNHQSRQALSDRVLIDAVVGNVLALDLRLPRRKWDRGRTSVHRLLESFLYPVAPHSRYSIPEVELSARRFGAQRLEKAAQTQTLEDVAHDRHRQPDYIGDFRRSFQPMGIHDAEGQPLKEHLVEAGVRDRCDLRRTGLEKRLELFAPDTSEPDKIVAQRSAELSLTGESHYNVFFSYQLGRYKRFAKRHARQSSVSRNPNICSKELKRPPFYRGYATPNHFYVLDMGLC